MMHSSLSKKLRKEIAEEYNIPEYKVKDVIQSYFNFVSFIISHESDSKKKHFPTVGVPYLGKFYHYTRKDETI